MEFLLLPKRLDFSLNNLSTALSSQLRTSGSQKRRLKASHAASWFYTEETCVQTGRPFPELPSPARFPSYHKGKDQAKMTEQPSSWVPLIG